MTWTHNGVPVGKPQRPWRLTRAQRVEMEAALMRLRGNIRIADVDGWYSSETYEATRALGAYAADALDVGVPEAALRARVAIALRAALRADEDARCEEVYVSVWRTGRLGYYAETDAANDGAWRAVNALREWPLEQRDDLGLVPLALWEIDERRRRETVRGGAR